MKVVGRYTAWLAVLLVTATTTAVATIDRVRGGERQAQDDGTFVVDTGSLTRALQNTSTKSSPPKLLALSVSKSEVDVSDGTAFVEIQATVEGSEVTEGRVAFQRGDFIESRSLEFSSFSVRACLRQKGALRLAGCLSPKFTHPVRQLFRGLLGRAATTSTTTIGKVSVPFRQYIQPGTYVFRSLQVEDKEGNNLYLETKDLAKFNTPLRIDVRSSRVDVSAPILLNLVATTPTTVVVSNGQAATVALEAEVEDVMFGVYAVTARATSTLGRTVDARVALPDIEVTQRTKQTLNLVFPPSIRSGNYSLRLSMYDDASYAYPNTAHVNATELAHRGLPSMIQVVNCNADVKPPSLISLVATRPPVINASNTRVSFTMTAVDDVSSILDRSVTATNDNQTLQGTFLIVDVTAANNQTTKSNTKSDLVTAPSTFTFGEPSEGWKKGVYRLSVFLRDKELNNITIGSDELVERGWPGNFTVL